MYNSKNWEKLSSILAIAELNSQTIDTKTYLLFNYHMHVRVAAAAVLEVAHTIAGAQDNRTEVLDNHSPRTSSFIISRFSSENEIQDANHKH